jgi:hypothetical protein
MRCPRSLWSSPSWSFALLLGTSALVASPLACSARGDSEFTDVSGADDDSDGAGNGSGSDSGAGGFNPTGGGTGSGGFEECAQASEEATLVPVNMFIAVDKSGSMDDDNKWDNAEAAFVAFFQDPAADSLRVALRFWPDSGCDDNSCNTDICSQPQVGIGPLSDPAHEQALISAFGSKSPGGLTPMSAALAGACKWAKEYQTAKEGTEKVVVVLVTDGEPTACEEDINDIAAYASEAYASAEVLTFAVGLQGSNEGQMDVIAQAGNTQQGFFIGSGNAQAELLAALKAIQQTTVACSFAMPESPDSSEPLDPSKINVTYAGGGGGEPQIINQVGSEAECSASGGWYYDDPTDPAIIELCQTTCDAVQADEAAKINIVLGCATKVD